VSKADPVTYGAYLAGPLGHCIECHSAPNDKGQPDIENQLGGGGMAFHGPWGTSVSSNITPTGLSGWTDRQIIDAITKGVRPDGSRLMPPMAIAYYAGLSDAELTAIVAYLRSLPPK
jgi:mono/diheme cytochrome c family protein